jgi:hypothetical protein
LFLIIIMKNNSLFKQCLEILQRDDVKTELKLLLNPIMEYVLFEMRPYAYVILLILFLIVIISIVNFIMLIYYFRQLSIKNLQ